MDGGRSGDEPVRSDVSALLRAWSDGDHNALDALTPIVYAELRRLAHRYVRRERDDHSLQTTALVNEAYIRLVDYKRMQWQNRAHFFAVSAQLMRRILVERARRHNVKRGRGVQHVPLDDTAVVSADAPVDFIALDDALNALARVEARKVQVVEMRFFGGLTVDETAVVLRISPVTVRREWSAAKITAATSGASAWSSMKWSRGRGLRPPSGCTSRSHQRWNESSRHASRPTANSDISTPPSCGPISRG